MFYHRNRASGSGLRGFRGLEGFRGLGDLGFRGVGI